jgi:hypothetical protein
MNLNSLNMTEHITTTDQNKLRRTINTGTPASNMNHEQILEITESSNLEGAFNAIKEALLTSGDLLSQTSRSRVNKKIVLGQANSVTTPAHSKGHRSN